MIGSRLILHVGAPKTGTTSVQVFLYEHREALRRRGILYPIEGLAGMRVPKHQWVHHFLHPDLRKERFARQLALALDEADGDTRTTILSTEGIFNHWWDYGGPAREVLSLLGAYFDLACIVWLREPASFFRSYYVQCLKKPSDGPAYGRDLSASEVLRIEWVRGHLRYGEFLRDAERVFGTGRVHAFAHDGDTVARIVGLLISTLPQPASPGTSPRSARSPCRCCVGSTGSR